MVVTKNEYLLNIWVGDPKDKRRYSMSGVKKLAQAIWQCKYHIVWCPKYRFRILKGKVEKSVKKIISQVYEWKMLEILELKKRYWGRQFWAKGYCVSTVGLNEGKIRKYVKWQLEKDKRMEQLKLWR
jgi:putative transposase